MKIAIIIAYFGKLPEYIQLFLDSCKLNYGFEWLIFSDDDTTYNYPSNVHLIKMNFGECKKLIQSKFDFEITLSKPQKLCDYKCAYGVIFEDYIQDYDWWGHCDLDQIFGNLNMFVTEDMLRKYDKLFSLGHLSLYKNSYKNNRIFMGKIEGKIRYKEVFVTERGCGFDEWLPGNVNDIYMQTNSPIMLENIGADINPYKTSFETVSFDINERWAFVSDYVRLYIVYNQGGVYLDTDVLLHNGIDELLKNSCWMASDDVRYISTGLGFGAEKGNWLIKAIMEAYEGYEYPSGTNVTRDTVVIEKQLSEWKKTDRTQLVNGIMLIGLKDYGKYATHLYTYTWADDEVRKKREADIMADKKKSSRTKVIWKIKTILRNPRFISFFDGVRGTKIDKVYTFIAYDLLDYGLLYFVQRLLRKIRK